jgi:hypothetical protein
MRSPSRLRRSSFAIATILLASLIGIAIAEAWFRIVKPSPSRQMVRGFYCLRVLHGVPIWGCEDTDHTDRHNRRCVEQHPERLRVLFFGSSITFGSGLTAAEAFTTALEARLNESRPTPGYCVLNFAEPGFSFEQKFAVAREEVARYRPALVMWEDWAEWFNYTLIGDTAYGTYDLRVRPDGYIGIAHVPDALNRFLFRHSRLYEYFTLIYAEQAPQEPFSGSPDLYVATKFVNSRLVEVPRLAESVGAKLVFYLAPPLDRSFAETTQSPPGWHSVIVDFARERRLPAYLLQKELIDHDYLEVRDDPCCHYNAAGHRALVPIMSRIILEQLDGKMPKAE